MTYKITRNAEYSDGFDEPKFEDFITKFTYAEYGSLFPELTEQEYNSTLEQMRNQVINGVGDNVRSFPGLISATYDRTPEKANVTLEFEDEQTYLKFVDYHLTNNQVEGFILTFTNPETRYYGDDIIQGRTIVYSVDPEVPPGLILRLGAWIARKWQIYRKVTISYTIVQD